MPGSSIQEVYSKRENCIADLLIAKDMFGKKSSTAQQYEKCERSLGFMMLYAPEELIPAVEATLNELQMRRSYLVIGSSKFRFETISMDIPADPLRDAIGDEETDDY